MFEVTLLSILQGVAEFLPISSSGHLTLGKALLGMNEPGIRLDIFLHVGTLLSICVFYISVIWRILKNQEWSYFGKVIVSAIPAGLVGVLFKDQIEACFADPKTVGYALMFTGVILITTRFLRRGHSGVSYFSALLMGIAQAIAILPGVSRSGMTIAMARTCDVDAEKSAEFSFLMSIPPIAGAALLEILKSLKAAEATAAATTETSWALVAWGGALAAIVGYFSLKFLVKTLKSNWFWIFGPYCILAGLITVVCT